MDVKSVLSGRIDEEAALLFSQGLANGYKALDTLMKHSPAFASFYPGQRHRGYLLNIFAQHGLDQIAAQSKRMFSTVRPNVARNHFHCHFETLSGVHVTAQYRGRDGSRGVKPALYRAALCTNGDLFQAHDHRPNVALAIGEPIYAQLHHGGWERPVSIMLAIPDGNQRTYSLKPYALPLVDAVAVEAEAIAESFMFKKHETADEQATGETEQT